MTKWPPPPHHPTTTPPPHHHPTATPFLRKGVVGNWREHFSEELSGQFDEKTQSYFAETDLEFDYLL